MAKRPETRLRDRLRQIAKEAGIRPGSSLAELVIQTKRLEIFNDVERQEIAERGVLPEFAERAEAFRFKR